MKNNRHWQEEERWEKRLEYLEKEYIPSLLKGSDYKYVSLDLEKGVLYNTKTKLPEFMVELSQVGLFASFFKIPEKSESFDWNKFTESELGKRIFFNKGIDIHDFEKIYFEKLKKK